MTSANTLKFSIRQRIVYGFLLLIAISSAISVYHILDLRRFNHGFQQYQKISQDTILMLEIDKNILNLQRTILAYNNADKVSSLDQAIQLQQEIDHQLGRLIARGGYSASNSQLLTNLQYHVKGLREKIESLAQQRSDRNTLVQQQLPSNFDALNEQMNVIIRSKNGTHNQQANQAMWSATQILSNIRTHSAHYFSSHEFAAKQIILSEYKSLGISISELGPLLIPNKQASEAISNLRQLLSESEQTFHKAVQADRNYLFLVNIVLAGESAELNQMSDELKSQFIAEENSVYAKTEGDNQVNQRWVVILSLCGSTLALGIAVFIGRRISGPIASITDTFERLTQGQPVEHIPGTHRHDEIGMLAKAANVFREKNRQTQTLLDQSKQFAEELRQREQALELAVAKAQEANLAKSQFLANMSHELRTPMNAILGMLSLLQKTPLTTQQIDYTKKTELAARALLSLLNDILDLSKAEAGKIELDPTPFNLRELLENLRVILAANIGNKPVDFVISLSDGLPNFFLCDTLRLQQILINLGSNAIKFTDSGKVKLSIAHTPLKDGIRRLTFCVSDTGIGIAPENQAKIFSGFTQAEASTTRRFGGTGLGLAISQRLVELMGGHLSLSSRMGEGSRFFFSLDLPELAPDTVIKASSAPQKPLLKNPYRLNGVRILLVEDNPTNQQIALELLQMEGAQVEVAHNGLEAVERLERHLDVFQDSGFDAILMDLQMPVMDGLSATRIIREKLQLIKIPIIAMTANAMASDRHACIDAGMNDHIGKPFDITQLINLICRYLHYSGAQPALSLVSEPSDKPTDATPLLDLSGAIARLGGNKDLYFRMLPKFENNLMQLMESANTLFAQNDFTGVAKPLHSLKGLAATMGFSQLASYAATSEKQLKQSADSASAAAILEELNIHITAAIHQLRHLSKEQI